MTAMELATVTDEQWTQFQEWIIKHDATAKYIAVVATALLVLSILQSLGVLPL